MKQVIRVAFTPTLSAYVADPVSKMHTSKDEAYRYPDYESAKMAALHWITMLMRHRTRFVEVFVESDR